jgi:hypothetical protein
MKKKLISFLSSVILLLMPLEVAVASSPTAVITAGSGSGKPGVTSISVPVGLKSRSVTQVVGLNFDLTFDENRLNVIDVTIGSAASSVGKIISWSRLSSDRVSVIIFGLNLDPIANGIVANVILSILVDTVPGTTPLILDNAAATDRNGEGIAVKLDNGSFHICSSKCKRKR